MPIADMVMRVVMLSKSSGKPNKPIIEYAPAKKNEVPTSDKSAEAKFHNVIKGIKVVAISKTKDHLKRLKS